MPYPRTFVTLLVLAVLGVGYSISPLAASTVTYVSAESEPVFASPVVAFDATSTDSTALPAAEVMREERVSDIPAESEQPEQPRPSVSAVASNPASTEAAADTVLTEAYEVPFYSQFADISAPTWQKVGCGIASLAMLIDYYEPAVAVDTLLEEGIAAGAYLDSAGWTYAGLIAVSKRHGLTGESHDFGGMSTAVALDALEAALARGPVMVSVHYTFDPSNPIPHLVIANGMKDGVFYYNDPAESDGGGSISVTQFVGAWKKRYIEFWPA